MNKSQLRVEYSKSPSTHTFSVAFAVRAVTPTKILMVGGIHYRHDDQESMLVEIDAEGSSKTCGIPTQLPNQCITCKAAGTLYQGQPLVCGGFANADCHIFNPDKGHFEAKGTLRSVRLGAASVMLSADEWLVAGGVDMDNRFRGEIQTSEVFKDGRSQLGPVLPAGLKGFGACAVKVNDSHVFFSGGIERKAFLAQFYECSLTLQIQMIRS